MYFYTLLGIYVFLSDGFAIGSSKVSATPFLMSYTRVNGASTKTRSARSSNRASARVATSRRRYWYKLSSFGSSSTL